VTQGYDDWYEENAPGSSASSHMSSSHWLRGLKDALPPARWLWTPTLTAIIFAALVVACASGCGRTVFVHESTPMRVGPMSKTRVYHRIAGEWVLSANPVPIPEGWYLVPPSFVE